ncbi:MAG: hypothetical protein ACE5D6_06560 [Candidatus Zixiibacteriota bacterium]
MTQSGVIERFSYGTFSDATEMPNFLDVQLNSYDIFLQSGIPLKKRKLEGLHKIFSEIFPVTDVHENYSLEYVGYHLGPTRYTIDECRERNMSYAAPLKVTMRLISRTGDDDKKEVKDIIEQDVYLGELPLITQWGTFIINGAERVVVSQLHRSPGVFFNEDTHANGTKLYSARIIPYRGSWMEFTTDINHIMYLLIDSKRKLPVSCVLRVLGYSSDEEIINLFYKTSKVTLNAKSKKGKGLEGSFIAETVVNKDTGEVLFTVGDEINDEVIDKIIENGKKSIRIIKVSERREIPVILNTIRKDPTKSREEALYKIFSILRPGDPPSFEVAETLVEKFFSSNKRYDLGEVGRYMINLKQIYQRLDELEPTATDDNVFRPVHALYYWPLAVAFALSLALAAPRLFSMRDAKGTRFSHADTGEARAR